MWEIRFSNKETSRLQHTKHQDGKCVRHFVLWFIHSQGQGFIILAPRFGSDPTNFFVSLFFPISLCLHMWKKFWVYILLHSVKTLFSFTPLSLLVYASYCLCFCSITYEYLPQTSEESHIFTPCLNLGEWNKFPTVVPTFVLGYSLVELRTFLLQKILSSSRLKNLISYIF
jgi:hypothetical protein